ncbi:single-stranded DNA-binding protein [Actinophytocola xanthii]|uniref:Single-stranded DNA-binding protein n=1 Tax=Actinophytocola xanthii TaxID=1912961 RepID=A0A1Q8CC55_9PSEU|nr:single-stranded DNA-binding protein [Actinophytocola xanthii]OLF11870.1 single-stranded DNA-binding protein [Actinophytocola xanthii]
MAGLPEITMAGTLTSDPELSHTDKNVPYVRFTVACNDRRHDPNTGQWVDLDAAFLRCTAWRNLAEHIAASLTKGVRVLVTGILRQRTFDDADGRTVTVTDVDVTEVGASLKWATVRVTKATTVGRVA